MQVATLIHFISYR